LLPLGAAGSTPSVGQVSPPLDAAWAKYTHAVKDHFALRDNVDRFLKRNPYRIVVDSETDPGWHVVRTQIIEEPPPMFGVQIGSMAHHLSDRRQLHRQTCSVLRSPGLAARERVQGTPVQKLTARRHGARVAAVALDDSRQRIEAADC
jgi:hypothetical protein